MVYMPADVLGWRPAVRSWLEQYLAQHAAAKDASETAAGDANTNVPSAESSQLESPTTPGLPGFGRGSFNAAMGRAGAQGRGSIAGNGSSALCPESMAGLRDFIWGMFARFTEPLLQWVVSKGNLMLQLSAATLMSSVTSLLEIQLDTMAR
jgi:hypothetical protein